MSTRWIKRLVAILVILVLVGVSVYALMPRPISVDTATVDRGSLEVTIDEEGVARIRDVFKVSAPVTGRVERLPVNVGDRVHRGTTAVATIHPVDPSFLDVRARREASAAVEAARAAVALAEAQVAGAEASRRLAESDLERSERLAKLGTISERALEKAAADVDTAKAQVEQTKANLELRKSELVSAEARLIEPDQLVGGSGDACCMTVRAPADGTVLTLLTESEQVVAAGAGLLEIGDQKDMEIVVHLLSSDAVEVAPGAIAHITDWGGEGVLTAKVRRVDPAAYTKVSALGIEEQRVDAILDLVDPYEKWKSLGHEFRVMVHIVTWSGDDVVRVPLGALFRRGSDWTVFKVVDGHAVSTPVTLGHRNIHMAEVTDGLVAGDVVVLHPSDQVSDGAAVESRESGGS